MLSKCLLACDYRTASMDITYWQPWMEYRVASGNRPRCKENALDLTTSAGFAFLDLWKCHHSFLNQFLNIATVSWGLLGMTQSYLNHGCFLQHASSNRNVSCLYDSNMKDHHSPYNPQNLQRIDIRSGQGKTAMCVPLDSHLSIYPFKSKSVPILLRNLGCW